MPLCVSESGVTAEQWQERSCPALPGERPVPCLVNLCGYLDLAGRAQDSLGSSSRTEAGWLCFCFAFLPRLMLQVAQITEWFGLVGPWKVI